MKRMWVWLTLAGMVLTCGCATSKAVSGESRRESYRLGTYRAVFQGSLFQMDKAVRAACGKAHLLCVERVNRAVSCSYLYKDINGVRLRLETEAGKNGMVELRMHCGAGDREACRMLLDEVERQLNAEEALRSF